MAQQRSNTELLRASEDIFYELWMLHRLQELIMALPEHKLEDEEAEEAERAAYTHTTHIEAHFWPSQPVAAPGLPERLVVDHNALVEAFALHARVLLEFFYAKPNPNYPDDVRAEQYFPSPRNWHDVRPNLSEEDYVGIKNRVGKEIAHLTYARRLVLPEEKPWPVSWIRRVVDEAASVFVSSVDQELIHPLLMEAS